MAEYSLGDALQEFLNKSPIKTDIQAFQIEAAWEDIMGKTIARYTDKIEIVRDKLIISTQVAPLKTELAYQREKILLRINEFLKAKVIKEVIIK